MPHVLGHPPCKLSFPELPGDTEWPHLWAELSTRMPSDGAGCCMCDATFRKLVDNFCAAWSTGNAEAPGKFYAKDSGLVFYDVAPFSYHGWKEFHDGVQKEFLDNASEIKLTAGKDLRVTRRGMIAWTIVPMHLMEKSKNGKTTEMDLRYTGIWEKRGASWVLVHDHLSAPTAEN